MVGSPFWRGRGGRVGSQPVTSCRNYTQAVRSPQGPGEVTAMTEQKPAGKSWESWLEEQINRARDEGHFDNLEGAGKPLPGLTDGYDPDWWVKKLVQRERVSIAPPPLALLR